MSYDVVVRGLAERDLDEAVAYLAVIDTDLALRFLDDFERSAQRLETFPFVGREPHRGARRISLDIFPYHLYYRVVGQQVRIIAVLHHRRDPKTVEETVAQR